MEDKRNLMDEFKGMANEEVKRVLDTRRIALEVAIENVSHDFNMGTIVRTANSFNVARVHIIGRKKYNRRGAMCTDKYMQMVWWGEAGEFLADQRARGREIVAIENNTTRALPLAEKEWSEEKTTLLFGGESDGISLELLEAADDVRMIESFGSTRSINVGVAAGIAMYSWVLRRVLGK